MLLVELIDILLDRMERDKDFRYFHLDGQTCILKDYTEIRPENRDRLSKLMKDGRVLIGPWYTMPDLFCPGDEALIRNLFMGSLICREWGFPQMPVAYTCDMFGHPSQMPQIYRGFDLADCVVGRGVNEHTTPPFFNWEAPDGSKVFTFKLQDKAGYAAFVGVRGILEDPWKKDDPDAEKKAKEWIRENVGIELKRSTVPVLCLIDALDHMLPAEAPQRSLALLREVYPEIETKHSTLPAFFREAHEKAVRVTVRRGELREPSRTPQSYNWLIANCVSSRVRMKQANDLCLVLLEKWAEPFMAIAGIEGTDYPRRFLRTAWEFVLLNHAHDSICGCSIDQVHQDMMYRYDQARIIADQLRAKAIGAVTARYRDLAQGEHEFTVTVVNPVPVRRREVVIFDIHLAADFPTSFNEDFGGGQKVLSFTLEDEKGREVPYQRLSILPNQRERSRYAKHAFAMDDGYACYTVAAELDLPALGFTSLRVKPCSTPVRRLSTMRTGPASAENKHLAVEIASNGTLRITDKRTGETYNNLLIFEDRSEVGDGWFHNQTTTDEVALSIACPAQVSVVHDGPEAVTFRVSVTMDIPQRVDWQRECRSAERVDLKITSYITLRRDSDQVDVRTEIENNAKDHRLRLLLPTDVRDAKTYVAHQPFDLVERSIALDPATATWQEAEIPEKPFLGFQSVGAGKRGLALLSSGGLHEGGVMNDARRTMLVTLLRSFRRTAGTPGEEGGQEQGHISVRYALMPFAGELPRVDTLNRVAALQAGLYVRQTGKCPSGFPALSGKADPVHSHIECASGNLVVSAVKASDDGGLIVRLWNPGDGKVKEKLVLWKRVKSARCLNLAEKPVKGPRPAVKGSTVTVDAGPHEIVTVGVRF
jgi:alpha-mannosidase/mannosylglycerate hydrolase